MYLLCSSCDSCLMYEHGTPGEISSGLPTVPLCGTNAMQNRFSISNITVADAIYSSLLNGVT